MIPLLVPIGLALLGGYLTKDSEHEMFEGGGGISTDKEVSEERYYDMLGAVPPIYFTTLDGVSVRGGFAVGEVYTHEIYDGKYRGVYDAFYQKDGKYYQVTGMVYFTDKNSAKRADYENAYAKGGAVGRKGTYSGKIVETESGSVMIGKISGYRGSGEPVYDVHEYGKLRKDIREKKGELGNNKIKELLNKYAKGGGINGSFNLSDLDKNFQSLGWRDTTEAYYGLDFTPFMSAIEEYASTKYAKGGGVKHKKGDIGKSGTQYGYTLKEWEEMAKKKGLLVSPKQWWKSQEGKPYTDSFGRKKKIGQHSGDERQSMDMYGYLIANGLDLGSEIIPTSAKKYVEENNYTKYANGGGVDEGDEFEDDEDIEMFYDLVDEDGEYTISSRLTGQQAEKLKSDYLKQNPNRKLKIYITEYAKGGGVEDKIISLYESFYVDGKEYMRLIAQGLYTQEKLDKFIERAKSATFAKFDDGRYDYKQEVYVHKKNVREPYLDKYKVFEYGGDVAASDVTRSGVGEYRVHGYLRSFDTTLEMPISEDVVAMNPDDAINQVMNMYEGVSPDSDLIAEMIDSYE